jgi:hypothetical protein
MLTSECICTHLRRAARGVSRHYDEALAGFGINVAQFSLLRHCSGSTSRASQPGRGHGP